MNAARFAVRVTATLAVALTLPASAHAFREGPQQKEILPSLDVRQDDRAAKRVPAAAVDAAPERAELRRSLGPQGWIDLDQLAGTPRVVARLDGFLTGQNPDQPAEQIALDWVREHAEVFGLDAAEIARLSLTRSYADVTGTTHLSWSQSVNGIPVYEHGLMANVTKDGELINVLGAPVPDLDLRSTRTVLSAGNALGRALQNAGDGQPAPRALSRSGPDRSTKFAGGHDARLVLFYEGQGKLRPAWRVTADVDSIELYDYLVDAGTGRIMARHNMVDFFTGKAWDYFPAGDYGAGNGTPVCPQPPTASCPYKDGQTQNTVDFTAKGWVGGAARLEGDNTHVYLDLEDSINGLAGQAPPSEIPASSGNFNYSLQPDNSDFGCGSNWGSDNPFNMPCSWDSDTPNSWQANANQNATQIFYFVNKFHDYLKAAPIGFDEASGNFEVDNGGAGGLGGDSVQAQALDGANTDAGLPDGRHVNNANMATRDDGTPPRMQMYLMADFGNSSYFDTNSGDEASVIYHEYVHGLSNRLVLDATGSSGLNAFQSDAMGEAWSDFYALDYLVEQGYDADIVTDADSDGFEERDVQVGYYVGRGIRPQPLDCRVPDTAHPACGQASAGSSGPGGYTLGDMGKVKGGPEFHDDGNIWAQTLWEIRQTLSANGTNAAGLARVRTIVTNGMRLSPPNPSMVDMRNAILQAEQAAGGQNTATLWTIFARRGMGYFAAAKDANDTTPKESFAAPASGTSTLTGTVTETETQAPVAGATVELLGPGNLAATTDANGGYTIQNAPAGTYPYLAVFAAGYEAALQENVTVSGTTNRALQLHRDWAAVHGGSGSATVRTIVGPDFSVDGCGPAGALDAGQGTGWGSTAPAPLSASFQDARFKGPKSMTIELAQAIDVSSFAVDPSAVCGDDYSASLGGYKIETSPDGTTYTAAQTGTFGSSNNGKYNILVPSAGSKQVRFVRMTMNQPQGAGSGSGQSYKDFMDMTELMVFGKPSPAAPSTTTTTTPLSTTPSSTTSTTTPKTTTPKTTPTTPTEAAVLIEPKLPKINLKTLLGKGLKFPAGCRPGCTLSATLSIDGKLARKLKLTRSNRAKRVTVGVKRVSLPKGETTMVTIKLTLKAQLAFKRYRRMLPRQVKFGLRLTGAGLDGAAAKPLLVSLLLKR